MNNALPDKSDQDIIVVSLFFGVLGMFMATVCILGDHDWAGTILGCASVAGSVYLILHSRREQKEGLRPEKEDLGHKQAVQQPN